MKNFNKIYEKIYKECNNQLEELRKKKRNESIAVTIVFITIGCIIAKTTNQPFFLVLAMLFIVIYVSFSKKNSIYNSLFKSKVVSNLIKEYNENLEYKPLRGVSRAAYAGGQFEHYDNFYSEDLITGTLEGGYHIDMAEVKTERESTDSDGNRTTETVFYGLFAEVKLSKILPTCIRVRRNGTAPLLAGNQKIEMDSSEFEKKFNVYATDKIIAMQLLTADIMQLLMDFKVQNKITPEFTITRDKLFIRFSTGNVFEAKVMKKALDYETLKKYYDIIVFTLSLTEEIIKNINETEV